MATINELKKYLNYEFSSGPYTGEDYKKFQTKYINYLRSISDVRFLNNEWFYHILIRRAEHEKDYHGRGNHYADLNTLPVGIDCLFQGL